MVKWGFNQLKTKGSGKLPAPHN